MQTAENPRELILMTLLSITRDGVNSSRALNQVLDKYQYLDKSKRAFITREVNGVLEHQIEIDAIIDQFSKTAVAEMKPVIATLLRCGVYELKYMDSVPAHAVINETVKLAKKKGFGNLAGFVNGVLRSIDRSLTAENETGAEGQSADEAGTDVQTADEAGTDAPPADEAGEARALSLTYSLPQWIVDQWLPVYGDETVARMGEDFFREKPTTIRFDPDRISREELIRKLEDAGVTVEDPAAAVGKAGERTEDIPQTALSVSGYDHLEGLASFRNGDFMVQDLSSMQAGLWADPKDGDLVLDVCAAPGGKALHVAELLHGTGRVEARDVSEKKVAQINENIARSGLTNIQARQMDALVLDPASVGKADIVLADLPCSGLGTIGHKPDVKYRMTPQKQRELADLQRQILSVVQAYVRPSGKLLYSTCTISRVENEENTRWFTEHFPAFHLVKEAQRLPGIDPGDGFYLALFVKDEESDG